MSDNEQDTKFPASSDEEVYEEEECMTDDEEEVSHDHICCKNCGTHTHVAVGKCSNPKCGYEFKFSASGYLIDGEDGGFICDDIEEDEEEESTEEDEMEDEDDSDEDEDMSDDDCDEVYDDEVEYVPKFDVTTIENMPRRMTRSSMRT